MSLDEARVKSRELWDRMAPGWEKHIDYVWAMSRPVGEWLVEELEPKPGQTILDIAAGPGDTGFVAAQLVGDEGKLISTDFAEEMVTAAKRRAFSLGITNAEFKVMDAENMDLADDSVDGVTCRWGFMLMLDPAAALRETRRVLRPGGKLTFAVWGGPETNAWVTVMGMVLTQRGTPPDHDPFGPGGMFSMSEHQRVHDLVTQAGYANVAIEELPVTWKFKDFEETWAFATELAGAIAMLIAGMTDEEVAELRRDYLAACESFKTDDGGYAFPGMTLAVVAH